MKKSIYIAETKDFIFFKHDGGEITMQRRMNSPTFYGFTEFVENALIQAIEKGEIIRISPKFAYDYLEVKKEKIVSTPSPLPFCSKT